MISTKTLLTYSVGSIILYSLIKPKSSNNFIYDKDFIDMTKIDNYLEYMYTLIMNNRLGPTDCGFVLDTYYILNKQPPSELVTKAFNILDSSMDVSGFYDPQTFHYVPDTSRMLITYKRFNRLPKYKIQNSFYTYISSWDNVMTELNLYENSGGTIAFWGGLWGYITIFQLKGINPPWLNTYIDITNAQYNVWKYKNHERNHAVGAFKQFCSSISNVVDLSNQIISDRNPDGGWGGLPNDPSNSIETVSALYTLKILNYPNIQTVVNNSLKTMIRNTYITDNTSYTKPIAGWCYNFNDRRILPRATAVTLMTLVYTNVITGNPDPYGIYVCI